MGRATQTFHTPSLEPHLEKLTQRQADLVKIAAKAKARRMPVTLFDIGRAAGYTSNGKDPTLRITDATSKALKRPHVREAYLEELRRQGVDDRSVAAVEAGALRATKKIRNKAGEVIDEEEDHATRLAVARDFKKAKGLYADKKVQIEKKSAHISLYEGTSSKDLMQQLQDLQGELSRLRDGQDEPVEGELVEQSLLGEAPEEEEEETTPQLSEL